MKFKGEITEEKKWKFPKDMRSLVAEKFAGKKVVIEFREIKEKTNINQLGYYRAVVLPSVCFAMANLGNHINPYDKEDQEVVHRYLVQMFPVKDNEFVDQFGEVHPLPASMGSFDKHESAVFITKVIDWATELFDIQIPESDKFWKDHYKRSFIDVLSENYPHIAKAYGFGAE